MSSTSSCTPAVSTTPSLCSVDVSILTHILRYLVDPASAPYTLARLAQVSRQFRQATQRQPLWHGSRLRADTPQQIAALMLLSRNSLPYLQHIDVVNYDSGPPPPLASIRTLQRAAPNVRSIRIDDLWLDENAQSVLSAWRPQRVCLTRLRGAVHQVLPLLLLAWSDTLTTLKCVLTRDSTPFQDFIHTLRAMTPTLTDLDLSGYFADQHGMADLCQLTHLKRLVLNTYQWRDPAAMSHQLQSLAVACPQLQSVHVGHGVTDHEWVNAMPCLTSVTLNPSNSRDDAGLEELHHRTALAEIHFHDAVRSQLSTFDLQQLSHFPSLRTLQHVRLADVVQPKSTFAALHQLQCLSVADWHAQQLEQLCRRPPPHLVRLEFLTLPTVRDSQRWHTSLLQHLASSSLSKTLQHLSLSHMDIATAAFRALAQFQLLHSLSFSPMMPSSARKQFNPAWWVPVFDGVSALKQLRRLEVGEGKHFQVTMNGEQIHRWFSQERIHRLESLRIHLHVTADAANALATNCGRMPNLIELGSHLTPVVHGPRSQHMSLAAQRREPREMDLQVIHLMRLLRHRHGLGPVQVDS